MSVVGDCDSAAPARHELDSAAANHRAIILRIHSHAAHLGRKRGCAVGVGEEGGRGGGVGDGSMGHGEIIVGDNAAEGGERVGCLGGIDSDGCCGYYGEICGYCYGAVGGVYCAKVG